MMSPVDSSVVMPGVIVLGGHVQAYGIIRVFGELGIDSVIIDNKKHNISKHSKYCKAFYLVSYRHTIRILLGLMGKGKYMNWVIYPTDDYYVRTLSENKALLSGHFTVAIDDWNTVEKFYDKRLSYPIAESVGVPIPKTYYISTMQSAIEQADRIEFPSIIKPAVMKDFYDKLKVKAILCNNKDELIKGLERASQVVDIDRLMLQEVIPGLFGSQFSVGVLFDGVKAANYIIAKRKRQHPMLFGNATTYAETVDIPELLAYAVKMLKKVGYKGVCEVEFKYDHRDGRYKFLEVNPRLWKWHLLAHKSHVPILESSYRYLVKGSFKATEGFESAAWIDIVTDLKARFDLLRKGIKYIDKEKNVIAAVYNKHDIAPFLMQLVYLPCFALSSNRNCGV